MSYPNIFFMIDNFEEVTVAGGDSGRRQVEALTPRVAAAAGFQRHDGGRRRDGVCGAGS